MTLINLSQKYAEIMQDVKAVTFADVELPSAFKVEYENFLRSNNANGYSNVEWARFSTKITTATGKTIFLTNFWFYIASELAKYLEGLIGHRDLFLEIYKGEDLNKVATSLRNGQTNDADKERIQQYFTDHGFSDGDLNCFLTFVTNYKSWGGGKTIDRNDYYVSPLLQAGNLLAETQSAIAEIATQFSESSSLKQSFIPIFISSNKSKLNRTTLISESKQSQFVYELTSFLVNQQIEKPLFKCLVEKNKELGSYNIERKNWRLTSIFKVSDKQCNEEQLTSGDKLRFFTKPFEIRSRFYYLSNQWTDGKESPLDIQALTAIFHDLYSDYRIIENSGTYILVKSKGRNIESMLSKPFLLLAGLSGTGKTRFVREQATATGAIDTTYCLVSVRPDWHEPSDLLGYTSRLSGAAEYVTSDVLKFIVKAWLAILQSGLQINGRKTTGEKTTLDAVLPYWLCLDEMNLAPVEQYFADYLSVLETREWEWDDDRFSYSCDSLLNASVIRSLSPAGKENLRDALGLTTDPLDRQNDNLKEVLWDQFCTFGIAIPFNLIVAGTVNMDETTHGFSRKVLDRALTFDFGDFFPNEFGDYFAPRTKPKSLSYPIWSSAIKSKGELPNIDQNGVRSIAFLEAINTLLNDTPFKLAYRALNELLLSVISFQPEDESELQSVWDDFLMCKVLPRIEGDTDKLAHLGDQKSLLSALAEILERELAIIWTVNIDSRKFRADLFRQSNDGSVIEIACRSQAKIKWMQNRLEQSGFTSFWP